MSPAPGRLEWQCQQTPPSAPACTGTGTGVRRYVLGPDPDERWAFLDMNGTIDSPHTDREGTLIAVSNDAQAVAQYAYDAYGQNANTASDVGPGAKSYLYRYTGQRLDPNTGLYDYKARDYSPMLGRFYQPDPAGLDQGPNLYEYVGGDPLDDGDPSGLCTGSRIIGSDGTCAETGGNTTGTNGALQGALRSRAETASQSDDGWGTAVAVGLSRAASVEKAALTAVGVDEAAGLATGPGEIPNQGVAGGIAATGQVAALGALATPLLQKAYREIGGILARTDLGPSGEQYALVAATTGHYANVRGGTTLLNAGDVWKYGETTADRYSQAFLNRMSLRYVSQYIGTQAGAKISEKIQLYSYFVKNLSLPPGNCCFR